jgi:hypothetical protein
MEGRYAYVVSGAVLGVLFLTTAALGLFQGDSSTDLRKPEPSSLPPSSAQFEALINERYPDILTHTFVGTPVVSVLVAPTGRITRLNLEIFTGPPSRFVASESQIARLAPAGTHITDTGFKIVKVSNATVIELFAITDSHELDRALVERFFPKVLKEGVPSGEGIWMLFDHEGHVLRTGEEHIELSNLRRMLELRYPGIQTASAASFPVVGRDGQPLKIRQSLVRLHCVWLATGSVVPE